MRGLSRLAVASPVYRSAAAGRAYSAFSGAGGGAGGGRGRGRGSSPPAPPRVPGQPPPAHAAGEDEPFHFPPIGRGRGNAAAAPAPPPPPLPSSPTLPLFVSLTPVGRGRGLPPPPDHPGGPEKPVFRPRDDIPPPFPDKPAPSGAGRGKLLKPRTPSEPKPPEQVNRHLRPRPRDVSPQPQLNVDEAVRRAREVLTRGDRGRGRGRGRRGRGGRGRGRGTDREEEFQLPLGDNANGEKLKKRLGESNMSMLDQGFEEITDMVLPSPDDEAYFDAQHTNNLIEYESEYNLQFDTNPDLDEKPPMSLEEYLETAKPFLMAYEGIQSQEEWEEIIKETMERVPDMKELIDMYCGPDTITAKKQQEELESIAKTLPENIPSSVKKFTDRALLSLQSNPGWGFDKKCQFMDKLVRDVSQHYK